MKRKKPLVRSTPIPRGKPPKRSGRVKPKRRTASEFHRIYGGKERVTWIQSQPCLWCGSSEPSQNCHTATGGMGRKADASTIVPLCAACHARYDLRHPPIDTEFARQHLKAQAVLLDLKWQHLQSRLLRGLAN